MIHTHIEMVARRLASQWSEYHCDRRDDTNWPDFVRDAEFAWFQADKAAKVAGYVSIWGPSREGREPFIAAAIAAFRESYA